MRQTRTTRRRKPNSLIQKLLPLALLVMVGLAILIVFTFARRENRIVTDRPMYQYFLDKRTEYDAGTEMRLGKSGVVLEKGEELGESDASPLYSREGKFLVLPRDMAWTDPSTGVEWCVPAFSTLSMDEQGHIRCTVGKKKTELKSGFLCDEAGTWIFLDRTELHFGGKTVELSPLSFYSSADGTYRIYEYDSETLQRFDTLSGAATCRSALHYQVNLSTGVYTDAAGVQKLLAASPTVLKNIEKK